MEVAQIQTNPFEKFNKRTTDYVNEKGKMGKDEFLKLLLTELKYQDPTDPMDTNKMLEQTSLLTTLEVQINSNKVLEEVANKFRSSLTFSVLSAIGKMASLGTDKITLKKGENGVSFEVYIDHDLKEGTLEIYDESGNLVRSIELSNLKKGVNQFFWDGKNQNKEEVKEGNYRVVVNYTDGKTGSYTALYGVYPIESVKFENGKTLLKLGSKYIDFTKIKEVFE